MIVFQRYYYYIDKGIKTDMVAAPHPTAMKKVKELIPDKLLEPPHLAKLVASLEEEVYCDYEYSVRKCIGQYYF